MTINLYLIQDDNSARGFGTIKELNKFEPESWERDSRLYGILPHQPKVYTKIEWHPPLFDSVAHMQTGAWVETMPGRFKPQAKR